MAPTAHSTFSASSAYRLIACPGSYQLALDLTQGVRHSTIYSAEGTLAHAISEACIDAGVEPSSFLGQTRNADGFDFTIDEDFVEAVSVYVEFVRGLMSLGYHVMLEQTVTPEIHWSDMDRVDVGIPLFGTADCIAYNPTSGHLIIADLKFGRGIAVEVVQNSQLKYYGSGALSPATFQQMLALDHLPDPVTLVKQVTTVIIQPRAPHPKGPIRGFDYAPGELVDWARKDLLPAVKKAIADKGKTRKPGDHCRFCPGLANVACTALHDFTLETARKAFMDTPIENLPPADSPLAALPSTNLSDKALADLMDRIAVIAPYLDAVRNLAHDRAVGGRNIHERLARRLQGKIVQGGAGDVRQAGAKPAVITGLARLAFVRNRLLHGRQKVLPRPVHQLPGGIVEAPDGPLRMRRARLDDDRRHLLDQRHRVRQVVKGKHLLESSGGEGPGTVIFKLRVLHHFNRDAASEFQVRDNKVPGRRIVGDAVSGAEQGYPHVHAVHVRPMDFRGHSLFEHDVVAEGHQPPDKLHVDRNGFDKVLVNSEVEAISVAGLPEETGRFHASINAGFRDSMCQRPLRRIDGRVPDALREVQRQLIGAGARNETVGGRRGKGGVSRRCHAIPYSPSDGDADAAGDQLGVRVKLPGARRRDFGKHLHAVLRLQLDDGRHGRRVLPEVDLQELDAFLDLFVRGHGRTGSPRCCRHRRASASACSGFIRANRNVSARNFCRSVWFCGTAAMLTVAGFRVDSPGQTDGSSGKTRAAASCASFRCSNTCLMVSIISGDRSDVMSGSGRGGPGGSVRSTHISESGCSASGSGSASIRAKTCAPTGNTGESFFVRAASTRSKSVFTRTAAPPLASASGFVNWCRGSMLRVLRSEGCLRREGLGKFAKGAFQIGFVVGDDGDIQGNLRHRVLCQG
jgi:hypothetical protein